MKKSGLIALVLILGQVFAAGAAMAETMSWKFRSQHPNIVDVQLYAPARNLVWPANGQVWSLKDYASHNVAINCTRGDKICYGAWVRGSESSYWGAGRLNKHSCTSCCYTCGATQETPVINLNR